MGRQLFEEVSRSTSLRSRVTPGKVVAAGIASVVHGATLALLVNAIFLIFRGSSPGYVILGVLALVLAVMLRPRLGRPPKRTISRERIPNLWALIDDVVAALGAPKVHWIFLSSEFNASTSRLGWRRRTYVSIGLPLIAALGPRERLALIGHEIGHQVNGDPRRGSFVGTALSTLLRWNDLLRPFPVRSLPDMVANALMAIPARLTRWTAIGLLHLIWREGQRAEYLADDLGSRVAGSDAAISALEAVFGVSAWEQAVHDLRHNLRPGVRLFDQYRELVAERATVASPEQVPEGQPGFRLDATHPPTAYRIEFVRSHPRTATVEFSADRSREIDRELLVFEDQIERTFLDAMGYRASLQR
jgi:Zn-dependent protease with chaperone function